MVNYFIPNLYFIDETNTPKGGQAHTPPYRNSEYSALTNFAHSLLEKISRREDGESTKSREDHISSKTKYARQTTDSGKKSWKRRKHKKKHEKRKTKHNLQECDKSGHISDLGSKVIREFTKIDPPEKTPRKAENSLDEDKNTSRSISIQKKRRRSKTGDAIKGLGLKVKQFGNFVEQEEGV